MDSGILLLHVAPAWLTGGLRCLKGRRVCVLGDVQWPLVHAILSHAIDTHCPSAKSGQMVLRLVTTRTVVVNSPQLV